MTLIAEDPHAFLIAAAGVVTVPRIWGWEPTFTPDPVYGDEPQIVMLDQNKVAIGYIAQQGQSHYRDYWEEHDQGEFQEFRTEWDRDEFIEKKKAEGKHPIIVDRYKHGAVHYSPANTMHYPDRRWDVAPCGVYVPPDDVPEEKRLEYATGALQEFSEWCNGEVYGVVVETLTFDRETGEVIDESDDACWEHIGSKWAKEALKEAMPEPRTEPA